MASGSGYALRLARTDTGAAATITMGTGNTLGDNLSLDFDNFTQDQYASAAQSTSSVETSGEHTISYDFADATPNQEITFDFTPTSSSSSTQSAGDYDTFYLHQDGSPRGTLESLDIDSDGLITGQFSNGTLATLGAVALSNVANPNALKREGENLWSWTREAGDPLPATQAGSSGLGSIESGALETVQRGFGNRVREDDQLPEGLSGQHQDHQHNRLHAGRANQPQTLAAGPLKNSPAGGPFTARQIERF